MQQDCETVVTDGLLMLDLWRFAFNLLRSRCGSMSMHSDYFPGILTGLLDANPMRRDASLQIFKRHCEAFRAASGKPAAAALLPRHPLSSTAMRFAMKFGEATKFERISEQFDDFLHALAGGWGQTKLVEDTFQKLRGHECRDNSSKTIWRMQAWERMAEHNMFQQYHREAITPTSSAAVPKELGGGGLQCSRGLRTHSRL